MRLYAEALLLADGHRGDVIRFWNQLEEELLSRIQAATSVAATKLGIELPFEPTTAPAPEPAPEPTPEPTPEPAPKPKTYAQAAAFTGRAYRKPTSRPYQQARATQRNATPAPAKRFMLRMETPVGEDFNPTAIRDRLNAHLPYPEVIGVARSKQGNLVVTCRNAAESVLKCQHLWMPGLPPVKKVQDEDRWARRVLYLKQPMAASSLEQEIRDFNAAKLAAAPCFIGASIAILFFCR
jgi:hypothetical protein